MAQAGTFAGLLGGLVKGFGATHLELEQRDFEAKQRDKATRINILQHAVDDDNLDDESRQYAVQQLGEIMDGKPGGKNSEQLKATLDPILATAKMLIPSAPKKGESAPVAGSETTPVIPAAPQPFDSSAYDAHTYHPESDTSPTTAVTPTPSGQATAVIPPAPRPGRFTIKSSAQKQREALDLEDLKTRHELDIKESYRQQALKRLPQEQKDQIESDIKLYKETYGADPNQDDLDAIYSGVTKTQLTPKGTLKYSPPTPAGSLPPGAKDPDGNYIDRSKNPDVKAYMQTSIGGKVMGWVPAFEPQSAKESVFEKQQKEKIQEVMASNPGMSEDVAKIQVLKQGFQKRRLDLANAGALLTGRKLSNQDKEDLQNGILNRGTAANLLASATARAKEYAKLSDEGKLATNSPYADKTAPEIEEILIGEAGHTRAELNQAVAKPAAATPPARKILQDPKNPKAPKIYTDDNGKTWHDLATGRLIPPR